MKNLRYAVFGAGFWANYQIPGWFEVGGLVPVAIYNRTLSKAKDMASKFGIDQAYDDVDALLANEELDFVDIITDVGTHPIFVEKAAKKGLPIVCQKPMGPNWETAKSMVKVCADHSVPLFINENWRWQAPLRKVKQLVDEGVVGVVFKGKIAHTHAFPIFDNQPFLAELEQLILTDIGSHVLDTARAIMGEAETIYCLTQSANPKVKGEDVATVLMRMKSGAQCVVEMSFFSKLDPEPFPQTFAMIEGSKGSVSLGYDGWITIANLDGKVEKVQAVPTFYAWANPDYAQVHASIVDCNRDIAQGLRGGPCETTGRDNLETVRLVFAAYESAKRNEVIRLADFT
jgi:D-apiose dehydrogenase